MTKEGKLDEEKGGIELGSLEFFFKSSFSVQ
jgi:hypothetical protein